MSQQLVAHADDRPDTTAIITSDGQCSWSGLLRMTQGWAVAMSPAVSGADGPIAVVVDGSLHSIGLAIAVTMSGRALVPLDPTSPPARRQAMIEACGAESVTTGPAPVRGPLPDVEPSATAFILFTSGSTGRPKGIVFSHDSALAKARVVARELQLTPADRVASALPFGFGAGLTTFLAALTVGAPTLYWDGRSSGLADLPGWLVANQATTLHGSASMLRRFAATIHQCEVGHTSVSGLRVAVAYGEALDAGDVATIRRAISPDASIVTWYATTEIGAISWRSIGPGEAIEPGPLHSGRVVADRTVTITADGGATPEPGRPGEICVRGNNVPLEYLDGTPTRIHIDDSGSVVYRTGDRGWFDEDGYLHLTGRVDDVVKIRGYLVEPAEISTALRTVAGIADAVVIATDDAPPELRAYIASEPHQGPHAESSILPNDSVIRATLRSVLPEWMIPREFIRLPRLPRTERGKIDRVALISTTTSRPAPKTPRNAGSLTEIAVFDIVRGVIGPEADSFAPDDDLMAHGVESLALTSVLAQVRARFHVTVSPESFLLSPSVRGLTQLISDETRAAVASRSADPILVPLQVTDSTESVFIIAGAGAPAISLMALCRHLHTDRSVYGLQAKGLESRARPDSSVSAAASMFISRMRGVAPHGPYTLVGHSMGGVVAQEIAVQLDAAGERVDHIIAIDSRLTEAMLRDLPGEPISDPGPPRPAATSGSPAASQITPRALLTMWLQIRLAGVWQFDPVTQWMIFYNTGLRALRRHRMNRCDAPLTVLRTTHNPQTAAMWARATSGPVDVIDVAGEHATLLREPWVREIALRCQGVLDRLVTTTGRN